LTQFAKQPRVFHRDDRLRREILQQRDLFVCKRSHFQPVRRYIAEQHGVLAQRHHQNGAGAGEFERLLCQAGDRRRALRCECSQIERMNGLAAKQFIHRPARDKREAAPQEFREGFGHSACCNGAEQLAVEADERAAIRTAEAVRLL